MNKLRWILLLLGSMLAIAACEYVEEPPAHEPQKSPEVHHNEANGFAMHGQGYKEPLEFCSPCHGKDVKGTKLTPSCYECHANVWDFGDTKHPKDVKTYKHARGYKTPYENKCEDCHGVGLKGFDEEGAPTVAQSCFGCHWDTFDFTDASHDVDLSTDATGDLHTEGYKDPSSDTDGCKDCHGKDLRGSGLAQSCFECHGALWEFYQTPHEKILDDSPHAAGYKNPIERGCEDCHGENLLGSDLAQSCYGCHNNLWNFFIHPHPEDIGGFLHAEGSRDPIVNECTECHGDGSKQGQQDLKGSDEGQSCYNCHLNAWDYDGTSHQNDVSGDWHADGYKDPFANNCTECHGDLITVAGSEGSIARPCVECHGQLWGFYSTPHEQDLAGTPHAAGYATPSADCTECHGSDLTGTTDAQSCYNCHLNWWDFGDASHDIDTGTARHQVGYLDPTNDNCTDCHGSNLIQSFADPTSDAGVARFCSDCHLNFWDFGDVTHDALVTKGTNTGLHAQNYFKPVESGCYDCHATTIDGTPDVARSCLDCHNPIPLIPSDHTKEEHGYMHPRSADRYEDDVPGAKAACGECHGANLEGGVAQTCFSSDCHIAGRNTFDD